MHFLPDVYVTCDVCKGKRYNRETLDVTFKGKSIADVLDMTVDEAQTSSRQCRASATCWRRCSASGWATSMSASRPPRSQAARRSASSCQGAVQARDRPHALYLDEPTTGLHFHDVAKLLDVLHELVESGNTMVVIEHNLEVIKTADWIIDLGPEGGDGGGEIVAAGPPRRW
jgi:excinuclease ABC subunit A